MLAVSVVATLFAAGSASALAQEAEDDEEVVDEITVTGTQIKGAKISGALAVSVVDAVEIEAMGISSGDELLDSLPEVGQNFFNEAEGHSGGVNSVRGDVGAYNLRNMGTGNTLVLLKIRRTPMRCRSMESSESRSCVTAHLPSTVLMLSRA
jgi:outer membrane receptor protein involved in Fe transport